MLKVFLVEDESTIRETLRDTVPWESIGYNFAGEAADGEMALPLITDAHPDVLITDIRMPFMDGLSLSKLVLEEFPETKIIILSGYDDFEYARQAIELGVEQYLLKPVTKASLMKVLREVRDKIEQEREQREYQVQFQHDSQEYDQYARRKFMERVVSGRLPVQQIYEEAAKLDLDIKAQCYSLAFFSILGENYSETEDKVRENLLFHFMKHPEYLLFRWNLTTYMVLIKGGQDSVEGYISGCIASVQSSYSKYEGEKAWYVAAAGPVSRLSQLPDCFNEVSRLWAYRYIQPDCHILTSATVSVPDAHKGTGSLSGMDVSKFNPAILTDVMSTAEASEIPNFVGEFLLDLQDAASSQPFCHYLMLQARFTATSYAASLGISEEELLREVTCIGLVDRPVGLQDVRRYITEFLLAAIKLRTQHSAGQYKDILTRAVKYIDNNYTDENISLSGIAKEVNISANYLSAEFSQEMKCTITEYITTKRMTKAKELLKTTDKKSGEIASEVGYKDPHYFSFLFKKTQGCTPRDYRSGGKR